MANAFKRKSVTAGTSATNILSGAVASSTEVVIIGLIAANKHTASTNITIEITDTGGTTYTYGKNLPVPVSSSLSLLENKIVLVTGDQIKATASNASAIDVTMSYLEIT